MATPAGNGNGSGSGSGGGAAPAAQPAPAAANQGTVVRALNFTIHVPDLRNGDTADIQQAAPKASIASMYKWAVVAGLPHNKHVDAVEYVIRGTYAQLLSAAGGTITDADRAEAKRKAIILGGIRAGATAAYKLGPVDMNVQETSTSGYAYTPANNTISSSNGVETTGGKYTLALAMEGLAAVEVAAIGVLVYLGMAVPILQGVSLVSTGHHYLPTTKNIFAGMKRQALGVASADVKAYLEQMGEMFDDMAFHKACHPISPPQKRRWAKDSEIAARLIISGHGAAAVRLPAHPSDAAIGKAGIALAMAATPVLNSMGHNISVDAGPDLIGGLERAAEGAEERAAVNRIKDWAAVHAADLAFCAGVLQYVHDSSSTGRNTLLAAYSVKKLMADYPTRVAEGSAYARVAAERTRTAMADGKFADPNFRF